MQRLKSHVKDLKYQIDELLRQQKERSEETQGLHRELVEWKDLVDKLTLENKELKYVIDEVEHKNRKLVERLNDQIYNKATEYKERTLQALAKS